MKMNTVLCAMLHPVLFYRHLRAQRVWKRINRQLDEAEARCKAKYPSED